MNTKFFFTVRKLLLFLLNSKNKSSFKDVTLTLNCEYIVDYS